jgi:hypothetical protein
MRTITLILIVGLFCTPRPVGAQAQPTTSRTGWPCGGKVDPTYIRTAEATGGHVMLFTPAEVSGVADEMKLSRGHDQTILRASGQLTGGQRDFDVPIDSSIESVYLFISVQCLQSVAVVPPPGGEFNAAGPGVESREFTAIRLVTIKTPSPGTWRIGLAGRGIFSLIVSANSNVALAEPTLSRDGTRIAGLAPLGERVHVEAALSGAPRDVSFHFIGMDGGTLGSFAPSATRSTDTSTTYETDVTLPSSEFRVLASGADAKGFAFQRVSPRLFIGR